MKGRQYAIFLLVWTFVACMITYYIAARWEGTGPGKDIAYVIILLLVIYPIVKCLKHISAEEEKSILEHLHCLIKQGKYDEAKRSLKWNQFRIRDKDFVSELKEKLDVGSQRIPAQRAKAKAQQGTKARVLKVLAYIWFGLFGTLLVISGTSYILKKGFWTFAQGWSPFSILSLLFLFSPGIAALLLAKWLEKRKSPP